MTSVFLRLAVALMLAIAAHATVAAQPRSEQAIIDAVRAEQSRHEALLERLVNQNSGTLNLAGVRAVGDMLRPEFEALGFTVSWVDGTAWGRAGHLVASHVGDRRRGREGQRMLLIGHLDTVFEPSSPFQRYSVEGRRATGPGVGDDKGGIVVILAALRAMHVAGTLRGADIIVVLTGDEERIGSPISAARADLIAAGEWADVALEYENLVRDGTTDFGTVARRGSINWQLETRGETGHSSTIFNPTAGYGAIYEMARILDGFRAQLIEPNLTFNVSVVAGGTPAALDASGEIATGTGKTNIIPAQAVARGDLRALTPEQEASARARMQAIVDAHLPGTEATIRFDEGYPPMAPTAGNRRLLALLNAVNRDHGLPAMTEYDPARRGAADSGFVAPLTDTLGGLGAAGGRAHAEGEFIDLDSVPLQAIRSAILMTRLSQQARAAAGRQ